jgi:hypothetical protein
LKISEDWHDQMGVGIHFLWPTIGTCLVSISNILVQIGWRPICWLAFLLTTDPHYIQVASLQQQNPGRGLEREPGMGQYLLGPSFFKHRKRCYFCCENLEAMVRLIPSTHTQILMGCFKGTFTGSDPCFVHRKIDGFRSSQPARLFCSKRRWHM